HGQQLQRLGRAGLGQPEVDVVREVAGGASLVDRTGGEGVMGGNGLVVRADRAAHHADVAVILALGHGQVIGERAAGGHPHHRVALDEDHVAAFLNVVVGEELVQPIHAVPDVQDEQLAGGAIGAGGHVDHVAEVAQRLGGGHALRVAGGGIVNGARRFDGG